MKNHTIRIATALMLMLLAAVVTFVITFTMTAEHFGQRLDELEQMKVRYGKLEKISEIVEKNFIAEYDEQEAVETMLAGYIDGLGDRWSAYYTAEETAAIAEDNANAYVGIGVTYSSAAENLYEIMSVTADGPADRAGIRAGDVMVAAAGTNVSELREPIELTALVRGEKGTDVELTLSRGGEEYTVIVTRDEIRTYSVSGDLLEGDIGYIAIRDFDSGVGDEFRNMLNSLLDQGARAFVFDVRNDPGGYLEEMRSCLDLLLPEGIVITTVDKQGNETPYTSDAGCIETPMAVLTNEYSISAAEFFAAALQEYEAAAVVGERTTGKGYSQQTYQLSDGSSVHISTSRYYTPKGNSLADTGVTPDILAEVDEEEFRLLAEGRLERENDSQLRAALDYLNQRLPAQGE
ncbi:MAG: S41 family peptidase [Clostridia bacterium]|nr:S41 family peptidase [Clostridia bacterium]